MKKMLIVSGALLAFSLPIVSIAQTILSDNFLGTIAGSIKWHIPTWVSSTDGTYIGQTQFRVAQSSPLPTVSGGNAIITLETYNPTGFSFYGTDLISNQLFSLQRGQGIDIIVRAKINSPVTQGTVGGIFLYALKPGSNTLHDEIDFELLGNRPTQAQTNIYANEPLGTGHPAFTTLSGGSTIGDYHTYEIKWFANKVSWYIDGALVRTATSNIPSGPMYVHLNMWAPGTDWPEAYSANIKPTNVSSNNLIWSMSVDSILVNTVRPK